MSTTNPSKVYGDSVVVLSEVKRRRRLGNLLYTRNRVARMATEHRSHGLENAVELYLLQLELEQTVADEFPEAFEAHLPSWVEEELASEHHPQLTAETCSLCEAIVKHGGSTEPPLAA